MQLQYISPDQLRSVWPRIRADIEAIQAKSPEPWWPEDVYHALKTGKAQLLLAGPVSWVVTAIDQDEWTRAPVFHLWAGYSAPGSDVFVNAMEQLKQMARASGCAALRFGSSRLGWSKRYAIHSITYEVPIE